MRKKLRAMCLHTSSFSLVTLCVCVRVRERETQVRETLSFVTLCLSV